MTAYPKPPKREPKPKKRLKTRKVSKRFAKRRDPKYAEWIRQQPCCVSSRLTGDMISWGWDQLRPAKIVAAHVRSRGAGGDDRENLVPLEWSLHEEQHLIGVAAFQKKYRAGLHGRTLRECAVDYWADFLTSGGTP